MKKRTVKRLFAATLAGTMAVSMLASFIARFFSPPLYTALADLRLRQLEQSDPPKAGGEGRRETVEAMPDGAGEHKKPG